MGVTHCAGHVSANTRPFSCAGVTGNGHIMYHAHVTLMSGLKDDMYSAVIIKARQELSVELNVPGRNWTTSASCTLSKLSPGGSSAC